MQGGKAGNRSAFELGAECPSAILVAFGWEAKETGQAHVYQTGPYQASTALGSLPTDLKRRRMVTSTPPTPGQTPSAGFQPAQQATGQNVAAQAPLAYAPHQLQLLMALQQQQQARIPSNLFGPMMALKQLLSQQGIATLAAQRQEPTSMMNSPVPGELGAFSVFQHTSTPLQAAADTSTSSGSFLSPPAMDQSTGFGNSSTSNSFQTPLGVLQPGGRMKPTRRRNRPGGPTVKTAEVWRFFKPKPPPEQAATCDICSKTIKATNSSTTGMIRHLRSCHREQHELLEEARNKNNLIKTLTACTDDKSRESLLKALSASAGLFRQSGTQLADSPTNSSVSPNSSSSTEGRTQLLLQQSSGVHSIDSLLDMTGDEDKASTTLESNAQAPPPATFTSPNKYMASVKSALKQMEHKAKTAMENQEVLDEEDEVEEDEEQDEDVENLAVTEEDSEEDATHETKPPKRAKLAENVAKEEFQKPKSGQFENIERTIAQMLLLDDLSTDFVYNIGFRLLLAQLAPGFQMPSSADFKEKLLPQLRQQLPSGDIAAFRQRLQENNRFSAAHPTSHWPISPSTTCESGFDEHQDTMSETASSAVSMHIVEQSVRSAQNISQSFGFSAPLQHGKKSKLVEGDKQEKELLKSKQEQ